MIKPNAISVLQLFVHVKGRSTKSLLVCHGVRVCALGCYAHHHGCHYGTLCTHFSSTLVMTQSLVQYCDIVHEAIVAMKAVRGLVCTSETLNYNVAGCLFRCFRLSAVLKFEA